jgi:hypothetical protein
MLSLRIDFRKGLSRGIAMSVVCFALAAADTGPAGQAGVTYRQGIGEGILARTLDVSRIPDAGLEVETWQILIAAHRAADGGAALPGGAVLEVLSGRGSVLVNDNSREVGPGAIIAVDEGAKISFDNSQGAVPLEWRVTLVRMLTP